MGLKVNFSKCEIAGLGFLEGILEAVYESINFTTNTIKILDVPFSYNDTLKVQNNFLDTVKSIQQMFRYGNSRVLSLEGRIIIFKTLAISKFIYLVFFDCHSKLINRRISKNPKNVYMALFT